MIGGGGWRFAFGVSGSGPAAARSCYRINLHEAAELIRSRSCGATTNCSRHRAAAFCGRGFGVPRTLTCCRNSRTGPWRLHSMVGPAGFSRSTPFLRHAANLRLDSRRYRRVAAFGVWISSIPPRVAGTREPGHGDCTLWSGPPDSSRSKPFLRHAFGFRLDSRHSRKATRFVSDHVRSGSCRTATEDYAPELVNAPTARTVRSDLAFLQTLPHLEAAHEENRGDHQAL